MSNVIGTIRGAGNANPSGAPEFKTGFNQIRVVLKSLVFCVVLIRIGGVMVSVIASSV